MSETAGWDAWLDPTQRRPLPPIDRRAHRETIIATIASLVPEDVRAALLVTGPANLRWLTGFTGSNGAAIVLPEGVVLVTDHRYEGRAAVECPGVEVVIGRPLVEIALKHAAAAGVQRVHFEGDHLTHRAGTDLVATVSASDVFIDAVACSGIVERARTTKSVPELARLARACAITEAALDDVLAAGLVGLTERELARRVEDGLREREAAVGFATIVAAGGNGAVPHHDPTTRIIAAGELVTIDCGARIDGHHADTTRTVAVGSTPVATAAGDLVEVFAVVAAAQQAGVDAAVVGATAADVDRAARDVVAAAGLGDAFVHGTGHGVGLEIHEHPILAATTTASLDPLTPLTVEPGVYLPGCGGVRVEDTLVTTAAGPVRMTNSPRTLLVV